MAAAFADIDAYIAALPDDVRPVMERRPALGPHRRARRRRDDQLRDAHLHPRRPAAAARRGLEEAHRRLSAPGRWTTTSPGTSSPTAAPRSTLRLPLDAVPYELFERVLAAMLQQRGSTAASRRGAAAARSGSPRRRRRRRRSAPGGRGRSASRAARGAGARRRRSRPGGVQRARVGEEAELLRAAEPAVRADVRLERRRLVGVGVVAAVDDDVGAVREGRDAGDQRRRRARRRAAAGPRR